MQNFEAMAFVLGCIGTVCWAVCFWWMHRISSRQDAMLEELHEVISDVHPQVSEIKEHVEDVREVVSPEKN